MTSQYQLSEKMEGTKPGQNSNIPAKQLPPEYGIDVADQKALKLNVVPYSQSIGALCWEACGRMLYHWKYGSLRGYTQKAGQYLQVKTGLMETEMNGFYGQLGLRALKQPTVKNIRHALRWGPVIFTETGQAEGHALVATGYLKDVIEAINPCAMETADFETNSMTCEAGIVRRDEKSLAGTLGRIIWYW